LKAVQAERGDRQKDHPFVGVADGGVAPSQRDQAGERAERRVDLIGGRPPSKPRYLEAHAHPGVEGMVARVGGRAVGLYPDGRELPLDQATPSRGGPP
jgi:hypothetical protein